MTVLRSGDVGGSSVNKKSKSEIDVTLYFL